MKLLLLLVCAAGLCFGADTVDAFGYKWSVPIGADWKVDKEAGKDVLKLLVKRPQEQPRRPKQFAIAETPDFTNVTVECDVKRTNGKSLILVYAYKDDGHFNYAHLSSDTAAKQPVHNGIFHVYGGDRVRISSTGGQASLPGEDWYHVKLDYDGKTGAVNVSVNGEPNVSLKAVDMSLGAGRIGLGSFFETAEFKNLKITGR